MKVSITILAAILALTTVVLTNHSALAGGGTVCQKKRSVAVGKDNTNKGQALFNCKTHLRLKAAATYGFDYWLKDPSHSCQELGGVAGEPYDYWQCICSAYLCGEKIKLQIPPPSQSFRQKPDRDPEFGPSPGRYLDMPNLGRFPGMGRGISPSRPRR